MNYFRWCEKEEFIHLFAAALSPFAEFRTDQQKDFCQVFRSFIHGSRSLVQMYPAASKPSMKHNQYGENHI